MVRSGSGSWEKALVTSPMKRSLRSWLLRGHGCRHRGKPRSSGESWCGCWVGSEHGALGWVQAKYNRLWAGGRRCHVAGWLFWALLRLGDQSIRFLHQIDFVGINPSSTNYSELTWDLGFHISDMGIITSFLYRYSLDSLRLYMWHAFVFPLTELSLGW